MGYDNYTVDGVASIAGYAYVPSLDSYLIIVAPITDFVNWTFFILMIVIVGVVLIISTIFIIAAISKRIAKPIIDTSERLKELSEGNLSDPVKIVKTGDELEILSTSLDETVTSLKMYVNKITNTLTDIADGNLTDRVHGTFRGDRNNFV